MGTASPWDLGLRCWTDEGFLCHWQIWMDPFSNWPVPTAELQNQGDSYAQHDIMRTDRLQNPALVNQAFGVQVRFV